MALIYVFLCVLLWALIPVVSKLGQSSLDNHQFLFWSSLVSFFTFVVIISFRKEVKNIQSISLKNWVQSLLLGVLGTYLYYILLYFGYANAKGIEVLIIQYCWPIFVIILSVVLLKEKLNSRKILSIIFGFLGVFLVLTKGDLTDIHFENLYVDGIVLLAAFVFGLFSVLSKKIEVDPLFLVAIYFLTATVVSFISMLLLSEFKLPTSDTILPILVNGIFVNGISYIFWIRALKIGKASFIAPFVFLTPVISTIILILFFNEPFQFVYIFGMLLVILGGLINKE
ncbi:DMT family transporter [Flammeovirga pectinis]|uniref:DMT family transporter n=1 Tax=Flammeovirga pectinis TaxID=2494373 RepID=A0A3S9P6I7_9BACT|nr:DMT family transporter [Flammeovirga pectinis]AZQ63821.1 DMT family transporter [Flammeovirga pectinis]